MTPLPLTHKEETRGEKKNLKGPICILPLGLKKNVCALACVRVSECVRACVRVPVFVCVYTRLPVCIGYFHEMKENKTENQEVQQSAS